MASGTFTSIAVHDDNVYAAEYTCIRTVAKVHVFKYNSSWDCLWEKTHVFSSVLKGEIRLSIQNNYMKCFSVTNNTIAVYSLKRKFLRFCEKHLGVYAGGLTDAFICNNDDQGSVLIAHSGNNRLQMMGDQGLFNDLCLRQLPEAQEFADDTSINAHLFVTSTDMKAIYN